MELTEAINVVIKDSSRVNPEDISDGYHTFGELYEHRVTLFLALLNTLQKYHDKQVVWKSKLHSDGTMYKGWFIAGIYTKPGEQITYHLPIDKWSYLEIPEFAKAPEWDGHSPEDVIFRLLRLSESP